MSVETIEWLNTQTLIGFTEKRGNAWHYKAAAQGEEPNHYPSAIPIEDVKRRLFAWEAVEATLAATILSPEGVATIPATDRKAICRPVGALGADDMGGILGIFKSTYCMHQFSDWLLDSVGQILDDSLQIGSAGLLGMGAKAWVQIEIPDNIITPSGVEFRPNLLACTSHDGTLATTFQRVVTNVVCDNTMSAALGESKDQRIKVKHSRYSNLKLGDARDALAIVHSIADDFSAQVERLTNTSVSEGDWNMFLDSLYPMPDEEGRARTVAENRREAMDDMYTNDPRVKPWTGTAYGVVQAVNTVAHHVSTAKNGKVAERNTLRALSGGVDKLDQSTLETLNRVLQTA